MSVAIFRKKVAPEKPPAEETASPVSEVAEEAPIEKVKKRTKKANK
jgi:hypothetical protein